MAGRFSVEAIFRATDRMTRPIARMSQQMGRFVSAGQRGLRDMDRMATGLVTGFRRIGAAASIAGAATAVVFADIVRTGAEFERTMMSAVAKFGGIQRGTAEFEALRAAAEEVGATTEFDAQQAAGALNVYAAAGFSAAQAVASLAGAGDLATVSGMTLDEAASTAADSLNALGMTTEDAAQQALNLTRVNDVLARTSSMVNTSVTDMAEAIKVGGGVAVRSGQSLETFGAMVGAMAQGNYKGAEAGTAIRNMFLRLQAPAHRGQLAMRALGVTARDSQGNMRDMVDIIGELASATASMGTADRNRALAQIFGAETIGPALAVLDAGAQGLNEFRDTLNGAGGAAADMASTMRDTTMGDIDGFTSAIDGVKTAIFGVVSGPFRDILRSLTEWTNRNREVITSGLQEFLTWLQGALPTIVYWGEKISIVVGTFMAFAAAVKVATAATALFNAVMAINPVVAITMAIIAAIGLIIAFWPEISAFFMELWESIKWVGEQIANWFSSVWDRVKEVTSAVFEFIVGALRLMFGPIFDFLSPVFEFMVESAVWIMDNWSQLRAFFTVLWNWVKYSAESVWNSIINKVAAVYARVVAIWTPFREFFSNLWEGIKNAFWEKLGSVVNFVSDLVAQVRGVGRETIGGVMREDGAAGATASPQVISSGERTARSISESTSTSRAEVTIRDESGRAEMTRRPRGGATQLNLQRSGAF